MKNYYCYVYTDPRKNGIYSYSSIDLSFSPIYVGKGHGKRYLEHLGNIENHYNPKFKYKLLKILNGGFSKKDIENNVQIIYCNSEEKAFDLEKRLISEIGLENLCNLTTGGEGVSGYIFTEYDKKKMSESMTGKCLSDDHKRHISETMTGKRLSEDHRRKLSEVKTGIPRSEDAKKNMSKAKTGKYLSENHRRQISETMTGKHHTDKTKNQISEAMKLRWKNMKST